MLRLELIFFWGLGRTRDLEAEGDVEGSSKRCQENAKLRGTGTKKHARPMTIFFSDWAIEHQVNSSDRQNNTIVYHTMVHETLLSSPSTKAPCLTTHQDDPSTQAFLLACLTAGGGITGYARTGSIPSIAAGVTVGALVQSSPPSPSRQPIPPTFK